MTPENLLLHLRTETLQTNLRETSTHMRELPDQPLRISTLTTMLTTLLEGISNNAAELMRSTTDLMTSSDYSLEEMRKLNEIAINAFSQTRAAMDKLKEIEQIYFLKSNAVTVQETTSDLTLKTTGIEDQVGDILQAINAAGPEEWEKLRRADFDANSDFFNIWVDLLGGIAMRDSSFDKDICMIADELVSSYQPVNGDPSRARTVPTRIGHRSAKLPRFVRVCYPELTIWALPLTAHEFWHIEAAESLKPRVVNTIKEAKANRFETCFADAFATYAMGPAYAYPAIGLLLDPKSSVRPPDEVSDDVRVHAILTMLKCLNSQIGEAVMPFKGILEELRQAWKAAKGQQAGAATPEEETELDQDREVAIKLSEKLHGILYHTGYTSLTAEAWQRVQDLKKAWMTGGESPAPTELREVLNAAWLARVDPKRDPGGI